MLDRLSYHASGNLTWVEWFRESGSSCLEKSPSKYSFDPGMATATRLSPSVRQQRSCVGWPCWKMQAAFVGQVTRHSTSTTTMLKQCVQGLPSTSQASHKDRNTWRHGNGLNQYYQVVDDGTQESRKRNDKIWLIKWKGLEITRKLSETTRLERPTNKHQKNMPHSDIGWSSIRRRKSRTASYEIVSISDELR